MSQRLQHGVLKHFVYSSVLHPQLKSMINHDGKRQAEGYLIESGLDWTILHPSRFLNDFPKQYPYAIPTKDSRSRLLSTSEKQPSLFCSVANGTLQLFTKLSAHAITTHMEKCVVREEDDVNYRCS